MATIKRPARTARPAKPAVANAPTVATAATPPALKRARRTRQTAAANPALRAGAAAGLAEPPLLPEVRVLRQFRLVFNAVKRHFQQVEKKAGIGGAQVWALSLVADNPGIGVNQLAQAMDVHQTTASNLVKAMVSAQMVVTEKSGVDRRAVQLSILPAGRQVLRRAPGPFTGVLPEALASLDAATLERLHHDLTLLSGALKADQRAAGIPLAQM
jgi:DNA-binding MarR family transcriptional regulator